MPQCNVESSQELLETKAFKETWERGRIKGQLGNWKQMSTCWGWGWEVAEDSEEQLQFVCNILALCTQQQPNER